MHSLEEMAAWNKPWSNKIPNGFKIDPHRIAFAVSTAVGPIQVYSLPSDVPGQGKAFGMIGSSWSTYRETAECRVRAPDGRWWLATRFADGGLSYVLQSQTVSEHHR
jgi:hypothetical protein